MAPLQKRALYGLVIGVVWAIAIIVVFMVKGGVDAYTGDPAMRAILAALFVGGLIAYMAIVFIPRRKRRQMEATMDERDRAIMGRAPVVQLWAVFISLAIWAIALTEIYWDQGQIPVIFPYLTLMSLFIVNVLSQSIGILVGYWRMR